MLLGGKKKVVIVRIVSKLGDVRPCLGRLG